MQVLNYWEGSVVVQMAMEPFVVSTFLGAVMPDNFNPLTGRPRPGSLAQSLRDMARVCARLLVAHLSRRPKGALGQTRIAG